MLAVEKTLRIELQMFGTGLDLVQQTLRREYPSMEFLDDLAPQENAADDEYIDSRNSAVMKEITARMTPSTMLLIRRENRGWTQAELSAKSGIAIPNISLMEAGKRPIGARTAKKLAAALDCDIADFIT